MAGSRPEQQPTRTREQRGRNRFPASAAPKLTVHSPPHKVQVTGAILLMQQYLPILGLLAVVGSGLMSGLLFAFSNFVMRSLLELPPAYGRQAMQRVNVRIVNRLFLLVFMGSTGACALITLLCVLGRVAAGSGWLLAGALAYLVGPLGITMVFNVPLNNALAAATPEQANAAWPAYAARWLRWNHVRTVLAVVATALLGHGLYRLGAVQA
jgi:uncharacterized membrane protein